MPEATEERRGVPTGREAEFFTASETRRDETRLQASRGGEDAVEKQRRDRSSRGERKQKQREKEPV